MKGMYISETVKKTKDKIPLRNPTPKEETQKQERRMKEITELTARIKERAKKSRGSR